MCASCLSHLLADARLKDETPTCPGCRCEISRTLCSRNLAVEKAISELPSLCQFCARSLPRSMLPRHEAEMCQDRFVGRCLAPHRSVLCYDVVVDLFAPCAILSMSGRRHICRMSLQSVRRGRRCCSRYHPHDDIIRSPALRTSGISRLLTFLRGQRSADSGLSTRQHFTTLIAVCASVCVCVCVRLSCRKKMLCLPMKSSAKFRSCCYIPLSCMPFTHRLWNIWLL